MMSTFTQSQLEAIADALGHTSEGLTGSEISFLLKSSSMIDVNPDLTKRIRLYNAFAREQNTRGDRSHILGFIRRALKPERYIREPERFEPLRTNVNRALAFAGLSVDASGKLEQSQAVATLTEAEKRASELRADLTSRGVHPDVLRFCRQELLADNYFHAVLEAVKSVAEKIRDRTGLLDDGSVLVDRAFGGDIPMLALNTLVTDSQKSEQKGFVNLVKGTFSMFRNPTAHTARIQWNVSKEDAEDLLSLVSLIHRRIDSSVMISRV